MDPSSNIIVNTPAGEKPVPKLAPADWVLLGNTLRAVRKAAVRAELSASGVAGADLAKSLDQHDRKPVRYADVERFLDTLEGQYHALRAAFRRAAPDAPDQELEAKIAELGPPRTWIGIVADISGLTVTTTSESDPGNDRAPAGAGFPPEPPTNPTGNTSPTESGDTST